VRTTITLADDVAAAVEQIRRERSIGLSEAVNELVRAGLAERAPRKPFRQKTYDMGKAFVDYSNVWEAIETVDGPAGP
jgi:metal-responsive CopG/Arc/MetJ family transcriptional regulator